SIALSPPPFKTKPTNFLRLFNDCESIRGEFVIDPSMDIPPSMLPPLGDNETEADRKNLCLKSRDSSVRADVWLLGSSPSSDSAQKPLRTTLALNSEHGSIRSQVHTLDGAAPFSLTSRTSHGSVRLALPRSFQGLLSLSTRHGSITVSDAMLENATQLSQVGTTRRYFIGDFQVIGQDAWEGDQVEIEAPHGSIRIKYVDEGVEAQDKKGLFSRLFGK
ncbi:hypothetical protein OG21DRAFT_1414726, partial [Imleria badia]